MKSKIVTMLTVLALCLALLPQAAFADGSTGSGTHKHCVCGATHAAVGDHTTVDEQTFTAWTDDDALPSAAGYYYLDTDVTMDEIWFPNNVVLCLNGHTITFDGEDTGICILSDAKFTLTDCKGGTAQGKITHAENGTGSGVQSAGTFNMYGGVISGNTYDEGGGVVNYGTFNMYGGTIKDNTADSGGGVKNYGTFNMYGGEISDNSYVADSVNLIQGGGVHVYSGATFNMHGGTIKGNTARYGGGVYVDGTFNMSGTATVTENKATTVVGGVYVAASGKMTVGGSAKVWGNTFSDSTGLAAGNIELLDGSYITLNSDPLTSSAKFGIGQSYTKATTVVKNIGAYKDNFSPDSERYELVVDGNDLKLQKKTNYIVVNNTEITDTNAADVLGDGTVKYDKATKTLTLTNATINKGYNSKVGIYADMDGLTIDLVGNNTITMPAGVNIYESIGISTNDLTIKTSSGNGSLAITTTDAFYTTGIKTYNSLTVDDNVTLKVTGGTAKHPANEAQSYGIFAGEDVTIGKNAKVTAKAGKIDAPYASYSAGIYAYGNITVKDDAQVTATGGTITATGDGYPYSAGIYATGCISIGKANVTATGGDVTDNNCCYGKASSCGLDGRGNGAEPGNSTAIKIADGATVIATGGKVRSSGTTEDESGTSESYGIYSMQDMIIGKATVTATGGEASGQYYAYSYGICDGYITKSDETKVAGKLTIADGATVTATGGKATTQNAGATAATHGYAYSHGIATKGDVTVGQNAGVTATANAANGQIAAYSESIYVGYVQNDNDYVSGNMTIGDGAIVIARSGNAISRDAGSNNAIYGAAGSEAIYLPYGTLAIGKATVTATAGTAIALNNNIFNRENYPVYTPSAHSYAVTANKLTLATGGKVTATAGAATCVDPADSSKTGKYVDVYSFGLYIGDGGMEIAGTVLGTAGDVTTHYDLYDSQNGYGYGGYAQTIGADCWGPVTLKDGANVKLVAGKAKSNGNEYGDLNSDGLDITDSSLQMDGGALYVKSGTTDGGATDGGATHSANGVSIYRYENGGELVMTAGWLKAEATDVALWVSYGIELTDVTVHTPEGGTVDSITPENITFHTVLNSEGNAATTVLLWDGTTAAYTEPVSNSGGGGGGHSKKDNTTKEEVKDETKTDEVTGETGSDFTDVKPGDYFYDSVKWAIENKVTSGSTATTFAPNEVCTRAQIVTFLWRVAGSPVVEVDIAFSDVDESAYYAEAIRWAASKGIVDGYGDGIFAPNDTVTREQVAAILFRFAKAEGMDTTQGGMQIREFNDYESISEYAIAAMQWAVNAGIMQGYDNCLTPADECIRAQIVTMLYRLLGK